MSSLRVGDGEWYFLGFRACLDGRVAFCRQVLFLLATLTAELGAISSDEHGKIFSLGMDGKGSMTDDALFNSRLEQCK